MLPNQNIPFPPKHVISEYTDIAEADAWYSGSAERLAQYYAGLIYPSGTVANDFFSDIYNQTIAPRQKFWSKQFYEERRIMLHVPIASDIARVSADLLFSEPPRFMVQNLSTQDRVDEMINKSNFENKVLEAAETSAGIGGVYLKINWDTEYFEYPVVSIAQPDTAIPEFRWGTLVACTFWKEVKKEEYKKETVVYRLLERHEKGKIEYGLYKGDEDFLGFRVSLQSIGETMDLQDEINTGIDDILCRYVPNVLPNRKHRGSPYGQSDFASLYSLMDSLDETYSSWARDVRLAKGRIMVPESFLQKTDRGDFAFDLDREVFTALDVDPLTSGDVGITMSQFDIRADQYEKTCLELLHRIISSAGYSPQSFGLAISGNESGTALSIRERKSYLMQQKKTRYWKPALIEIVYLMQLVDNIHIGNRYVAEMPDVEFGDSTSTDMTQLSNTIEVLSRAKAISIETSIRLSNPDWSDEKVNQEVMRIKEENGLMIESPFQSGDLT